MRENLRKTDSIGLAENVRQFQRVAIRKQALRGLYFPYRFPTRLLFSSRTYPRCTLYARKTKATFREKVALAVLSGGRLVFHMMGALAEFERTLISERTRAGLKVAKDAGKTLGCPRSLSTKQVNAARKALADGDATIEELAEQYGVHVRTLVRALQRKK